MLTNVEAIDRRIELPDLTFFTARDGAKLYYRHYPAQSDKHLIVVHGISEDSKYLHPLAAAIASRGLAQVYVPDMRGCGTNPQRRGDIDYVGQMDDDLDDLIRMIRSNHPSAEIIMGGHSAGGGNALRMAIKPCAKEIKAFLLLAPAISPDAPTHRKNNPQSVTKVHIGKIIMLMILNKLGIRGLNHLVVMDINRPKEQLHDTLTLRLSFRMALSRLPMNQYVQALQALTKPTLVLVGQHEEEFLADQYEPLFSRYNRAEVKIVPNENHDGILSSAHAHNLIEK